MSNPTNTVDITQGLTAFLAAHSALLQQKIDKPGGVVPAAGTIRNNGALYGNFLDDFLLAYMADFNSGRFKKTVGATTDATPTDIGKVVTIPDGGHIHLEVLGWGRVAANDWVFQEFQFRAERDGAAVNTYTDVPGTPRYSAPTGTLTTASLVPFVSGNDINIQVTGEAVTNISWEIMTRCAGAIP